MKTNKAKALREIPGKEGLPYIGTLFNFIKDPVGLTSELEKKHGRVFRTKTLGEHNVTLLGEEAHKYLLLEQQDKVSSKEAWETVLGDLFPNGLMLMDGDEHKFHRSIIRTAFQKEPMRGYLDLMIPTVEQKLTDWASKKSILAFEEVKELTLKVAGKVFFGVSFQDKVSEVNQAIMNIVQASLALPINLPFTKFGKGIKARKYLVAYFNQMITDKRANPSKDLFSILCNAKNEEGDSLTDQQVIDHLIFILMAAHDTTASAVTSWIYEMGKNPEWQAKIRTEIQDLDPKTLSDPKSVKSYEYLNNSIKEILRMYPPLLTIPRRSKCPMHFNHKTIPADTNVAVMLHHTHHLETIWENPEVFDPNRFNEERGEHKKCPHAYAPFGAGQHHCIGYAFAEMEMRLIMSHLLKYFEWKFDETYHCDFARVPINVPKDGLPLTLKTIK